MSLDFNALTSLKLPTSRIEKGLKNGFDGIRNYMLEGRYLYYDTYYEFEEDPKKRVVYVFDLHFNTLFTSFDLNELGNEMADGTRDCLRILKLKFLPYSLTEGLLYNGRILQRIQIDPKAQKAWFTGDAYSFLPVQNLDVKFVGENLMVMGYHRNENSNFLYLLKWPCLDKIVAQVDLITISPMWNSVKVYINQLVSQPNMFSLIYFQDLAMETNQYKYEPSVFSWDSNKVGEESETSLTKVQTTGLQEWQSGTNVFLRGEWKSHLFFATLHSSLQHFHEKQTRFYVFNSMTKIWSELAPPFNGMISLAPTIDSNADEPLILCSYNFKNMEGDDDVNLLPFISNIYRLQIRQPEPLETLCRCAAMQYGIFDDEESEDQSITLEGNVPNSKHKTPRNLKRNASSTLPDHLTPKMYRLL